MDTFGIRSGAEGTQLASYAARSDIENIQLDTQGIRSGAEGTHLGGYNPRSGIENTYK